MPTVVVAREFDEFSRRLTENGVTVINCPVIATKESNEAASLRSVVENGSYDGIFVTSAAAAEIVLREVFSADDSFEGRLFVLGKKSHAILADKVLRLSFNENANTAREMLQSIPREELENRRFLFVRGDRSLNAIAGFLDGIATVEEIVVYRTKPVAVPKDTLGEISGLAAKGAVDAFCFFSPSGAESFLSQFDENVLRSAKIATIGRTTAKFFEEKGFEVAFTAVRSNVEDFADGLLKQHFESRLRAA